MFFTEKDNIVKEKPQFQGTMSFNFALSGKNLEVHLVEGEYYEDMFLVGENTLGLFFEEQESSGLPLFVPFKQLFKIVVVDSE